MSFILDALKKAESERSRQSGPVLMDVRIAPPRRGLPTWAWVLGGVLLANLGVLAWLLLRTPQAAAPEPATTMALPAAPPPASAQPSSPPPLAADPATHVIPPPALPAAASPPVAVPPAPPIDDSRQLPSAQELQQAGISLPPLLLNLHVYDAVAANRYVLLNGIRLTEGEYTPEGIKVERITVRGVVLEASGRRFLLAAGG